MVEYMRGTTMNKKTIEAAQCFGEMLAWEWYFGVEWLMDVSIIKASLVRDMLCYWPCPVYRTSLHDDTD